NVHNPQAIQNAARKPPHPHLLSYLVEDGIFVWWNKVGNDIRIGFRYLTDIRRLVEVHSAVISHGESGLRHSCERVQPLAVRGQRIGRDHSNARRIKTARNGRTGHTAATKARFYRRIESLFKRVYIVLIACEPYIRDVFRVPEPKF